MITKHEEQLNRYFEHTLSPSEEQNFLISVAASDELRIAFRSQLELMKAVRTDKDALHSGMNGQPVARVRDRTLAALGLSATAATPFIEQELMRESRGNTPRASHGETASVTGGTRMLDHAQVMPPVTWLGKVLRTPTLALATGLALGILSTTAVEHFTASGNPNEMGNPAPAVQMKTAVQPTINGGSSTIETIPATNGLVNSNAHPAVVRNHAREGSHPVSTSPVEANEQSTVKTAATSTAIPTIDRSNAAEMHANKITIKRPNDSTAAK